MVMGYSATADNIRIPETAVLPSFNISPNPVSGNTFAINLNFTQSQFPGAALVFLIFWVKQSISIL